jgi:hypothetical protein
MAGQDRAEPPPVAVRAIAAAPVARAAQRPGEAVEVAERAARAVVVDQAVTALAAAALREPAARSGEAAAPRARVGRRPSIRSASRC